MANDVTTLNATLREGRGKGSARKLRREGRIPAVVYGHGEDTRAISVDEAELDRLFAHISIENTLIELKVDGGAPVRTLVREVQTHPWKQEVLHVDFYQIRAGEKITLDIPIRLIGTAAGAKEGGILQQRMHELEVECLPAAIPESIEVDISELELGDSLHVGDLPLPEGVETDVDPERTVCSVVTPTVLKVEEEEEVEVPEELEGVGGEVEAELVEESPEEEETPPATEEGGHEGSGED
ncbi:MAG: 50S ribosomal protein L25/general stress protein Ctc [Gemmatimonadota bacterium]